MSRPQNSIEELVTDPSFRRWVKGEASIREQKRWDRWVMESRRNRKVAMKAQEEIEGFVIKPGEAPDTRKAWHQLQMQIEVIKKGNVHQLRAAKKTKDSKQVWFVRIAAAFLLAAITGILVTQIYQEPVSEAQQQRVNEVRTEMGEQKTVTFHDGSEVILDGNSRIKYTINQNNPFLIEVFLDGEAYFSVEKRETEGGGPFRVQTAEGLISVLGTRFVVSSRTNQTRVVLENGSVVLKPVHHDTEVILEPGQLGEFNGLEGSVHTRSVNTDVYSSWIYGRLTFEQASLKEVIERLENTFGIRVEVHEPGLLENKITGSIERSDLEVITSALSKLLNIPIYESEKENVVYMGEQPNR